MKFNDLYNSVIEFWPRDIVVNDNGVPSPEADGHYFPSLSNARKTVEDITGDDDPWLSLMVWTMFQEFHKEAMKAARSGLDCISPGNVSLEALETRFFDNLHEQEWQHLLIDDEGDA